MRYRNIVTGLLQKNPKFRLGSGLGGSNDILNHPFFDAIDWDELKEQKDLGPFVPQLQDQTDTSAFVLQAEEDLEPVEEYTPEMREKFDHFFAEF